MRKKLIRHLLLLVLMHAEIIQTWAQESEDNIAFSNLSPLQKDSLALVELYDSTDGLNWVQQNHNWESGLLTSWSGVKVSNGRVSELILSGFGLKGHIPSSIGQLTGLTTLMLNRNKLDSIPDEIGNLQNLENLSFGYNLHIRVIPATVGNLTYLKFLDFKGNHIDQIPESLQHLVNLETLHANFNKITTFPESLSTLKRLSELLLNNNRIKDIRPILKLTKLTNLELGFNEIKEIPGEIGNLTLLKYLDLEKNEISSISPKIGRLEKINRLSLIRNKLESIPDEVGDLRELANLYLQFNKLKEVPFSLSKLPNLEILNLSNNLLSEMPADLGRFKALRNLRVENNKLDFADFVALIPDGKKQVIEFSYSPQDSLIINLDQSVKRLMVSQAQNNHYQWTRNGVLLKGETTSFLQLTQAQYEANEAYQCKITNDLFPDLTLYSKIKQVK